MASASPTNAGQCEFSWRRAFHTDVVRAMYSPLHSLDAVRVYSLVRQNTDDGSAADAVQCTRMYRAGPSPPNTCSDFDRGIRTRLVDRRLRNCTNTKICIIRIIINEKGRASRVAELQYRDRIGRICTAAVEFRNFLLLVEARGIGKACKCHLF